MRVSKKDIFLSLPMSEEMRLRVGKLEKDKSSQWDFLAKTGAGAYVLNGLIADREVSTKNQNVYQTMRLANTMLGIRIIIGEASFNDTHHKSLNATYKHYRLRQEDEVISLAKELRGLIAQTLEIEELKTA